MKLQNEEVMLKNTQNLDYELNRPMDNVRNFPVKIYLYYSILTICIIVY